MARMTKPRDLPEKICPCCNRPFRWRKKWARIWDEVRYCSDACRRARSILNASKKSGTLS